MGSGEGQGDWGMERDWAEALAEITYPTGDTNIAKCNCTVLVGSNWC